MAELVSALEEEEAMPDDEGMAAVMAACEAVELRESELVTVSRYIWPVDVGVVAIWACEVVVCSSR